MLNFFIIILLVFIDHLLKYIFKFYNIDFFIFKTAINYWISFGIYFNKLFIIAVSILFIIFITYFYHEKKINKWVFIFLFSGALSNLIDRLIYWYVIDYIDFFGLFIFNLADIYISFGIIIYIFYEISNVRKN